jgi:putative restriction endonuclease
MPSRLSKPALLDTILEAIEESGWGGIILDSSHPFLLRIYNEEKGKPFNLRIYIWNVTHGGGSARAADEFRIQVTMAGGEMPTVRNSERTVLLGWHSDYAVFVGFDINKHVNLDSFSPSIQIKESALLAAHNKSFATYDKENGEIAIAFQPVFFVDYSINADALHATGSIPAEVELLDQIGTVSDEAIESVASDERKEVISQIKKKYRDSSFRARVLTAYRMQCAMCGLQMRLVEAAHILPVAAPRSPDSTNNGLTLCVLHHKAYDRNLLSFNKEYRIEVNEERIKKLGEQNQLGGLDDFRSNLKPAIILPSDRRDHPDPELIESSRQFRGWELG